MTKTYAIMHSLCAQHYASWDKRLGIPVVVLGAVTASSIFASSSDQTGLMHYINGALALALTALAGVTKFLGIAEKLVKHQTASFKYTSIGMNIDTMLSFPRHGRSSTPQEFMNSMKGNILEVRENAPEVLPNLLAKYLRSYDRSLIGVTSRVNARTSSTSNMNITSPTTFRVNGTPTVVTAESNYMVQQPPQTPATPRVRPPDFDDPTSTRIVEASAQLQSDDEDEDEEKDEEQEVTTRSSSSDTTRHVGVVPETRQPPEAVV